MTPERLAEIRKKVSVGVYYSDTLVRELLDHIAQLEAQRGVAVVVPALHDGRVILWWNEMADKNHHCHWTSLDDAEKIAATREYIIKHMTTIPADRVLADGMVGVDRKVLTDLREGLQNILDEIPNGEDQGEGYTDPVEIQCWKIREAKSALDALRAQQAKGE